MVKILNGEGWRARSRLVSFMLPAIVLTFAFEANSRNSIFGNDSGAGVYFLPTISLLAFCLFLNLVLPTWTKSFVESVAIRPLVVTITQCEAKRLWQRSTVIHYELPITSIESATLIFEDRGESPDQPHLSLTLNDAPSGCPKSVVLYAPKETVLKFIEIANTRIRYTTNLRKPDPAGEKS
jgi:hypothetical protein